MTRMGQSPSEITSSEILDPMVHWRTTSSTWVSPSVLNLDFVLLAVRSASYVGFALVFPLFPASFSLSCSSRFFPKGSRGPVRRAAHAGRFRNCQRPGKSGHHDRAVAHFGFHLGNQRCFRHSSYIDRHGHSGLRDNQSRPGELL